MFPRSSQLVSGVAQCVFELSGTKFWGGSPGESHQMLGVAETGYRGWMRQFFEYLHRRIVYSQVRKVT